MVTRLLEVAPYAGAFIAAALVILAAGVAIAQFAGMNGPDESCPEWVLDETDTGWPFAGPVWISCPHRRPCPLHDPRHLGGRRRGRKA